MRYNPISTYVNLAVAASITRNNLPAGNYQSNRPAIRIIDDGLDTFIFSLNGVFYVTLDGENPYQVFLLENPTVPQSIRDFVEQNQELFQPKPVRAPSMLD